MLKLPYLLFAFFLIVGLHPFYSVANQAISPDSLDHVDKIIFTPPANWKNAESTALPKHVKLMVVGKGANEFPPSISIATENYTGSLKDYLKIVKQINSSKGQIWKDLGNLRTQAGNTSLSQTDFKSEWGDIRLMHVILKRNGVIYIVTAAALKEEFPRFYKEIFASLRSLRFDVSP